MRLKAALGILVAMVIAESAFILLSRHSMNRFKAVDVGGYVTFDSATGQICSLSNGLALSLLKWAPLRA